MGLFATLHFVLRRLIGAAQVRRAVSRGESHIGRVAPSGGFSENAPMRSATTSRPNLSD